MVARLGIMGLAMALLITPYAVAQDEKADPKSDAKSSFSALQAEYNKAYQEMGKRYRAAPAAEKGKILNEELPKLRGEYAAKYLEFAKGADDNEVAGQALAAAATMGGSEEVILQAREVADKIGGDIRGIIRYHQAMALKGGDITEANADTVVPLFKEIKEKYGDVELKVGTRSRGKLGALVDNELFVWENLGIGKVAPEITGEDIDGVKFSLSDYRGKVVVLDFWGDW